MPKLLQINIPQGGNDSWAETIQQEGIQGAFLRNLSSHSI